MPSLLQRSNLNGEEIPSAPQPVLMTPPPFTFDPKFSILKFITLGGLVHLIVFKSLCRRRRLL